MSNRKFQKTARRNQAMALFFTLVFHIALIALIAGKGQDLVQNYVPEQWKDWLGIETSTELVEDAPKP